MVCRGEGQILWDINCLEKISKEKCQVGGYKTKGITLCIKKGLEKIEVKRDLGINAEGAKSLRLEIKDNKEQKLSVFFFKASYQEKSYIRLDQKGQF